MPAYRFNTGEELTYELVSKENLLEEKEESNRRYETKLKWNVYPIRQNDDDSWRLVVRTRITMLRFDRNADGNGDSDEEKRHVRFKNDFLSYCDLLPDGRYEKNPTMNASYAFGFPPHALFTPLSDHPDGYSPPVGEGTFVTEKTSFDAGVASIDTAIRTPTAANYQSTASRTTTLDQDTGRITQFVTTNKADWARNPWHTRRTYKLTDVKQHSPEWLAKFTEESDTYFATHESWWDTLLNKSTKVRTEQACRDLLDASRTQIEAARTAATLPEVQAAFEGMLALHDRDSKMILGDAAEKEELFAMPAVDWESVNLKGEPRRLVDYRGKVLILDFWYRGCAHCILALPKVKQLHAKYKERGVVVLGVSNDDELSDAEHVVNTFAIPYESIRNRRNAAGEETETALNQTYKHNSWPTFIVLDQTGRVAEVVRGNAEDLVEHVSSVVDSLLATPPTTVGHKAQ